MNGSDVDEEGVDDARLTRARSSRIPYVFRTLDDGEERRLHAERRARALAASREAANVEAREQAAAAARAAARAAAMSSAATSSAATSVAFSFGPQLGMPTGSTGTSSSTSSRQSTSQMARSQFSPLTPREREMRELQQVERIRAQLEKELKEATDGEREIKNRTTRLETLESDKADLEGLDDSGMNEPMRVLRNNMLSLHAHVDSRLDFMQSTLDQILDILTRPGFRPPAQSPLPLTAMSGPFPVQAGSQPSGTSSAVSQTVASSSSGPAVIATSPQQSVQQSGQLQGQWYPKTPMKPPLAFSARSLGYTDFTNDGTAGRNPGKGSKHWICKYCETRFDGTASNLRTHFLKKCSLDLVTRPMSVEERVRRAEGIRIGKNLAELIERRGKSSTPTSNLPSASSLVIGAMGAGSGAADAGGVPLRVATSGESGRAAPQTGRPMRQTLIEDVDSIITRNEHTNRFLDNFLFCTNQPFSLVDNEYFLELIDAVKKAHPSWLPYHRDNARTRRLDATFGRTRADVTAMTTKWQVTGCMLQMDGWSDRRNRPHLNVMVSSPIGTVFWKSVCMEGKDKDSAAYFKILHGLIKEIGSNAVVGVVMDNARVCVKAGKMVEAAYPQIFCVGCTAHALDLALEDMYKQLGWLAVVVDAGNVVGEFFTNVDKARALFDKFSSNLKLKRPAVTRFATSHDMLASLKRGRNALEKCVCDTAWVDKMVRADQLAAFREVTSIVLGRDGFWDKVEKALAVMSPVVELLRLVDGPGATMSKVYFKMDALVERMRGLECLTPGEKAEIEDILMHPWSFMTSELHCAAAFLDPVFRHSALAERDRECTKPGRYKERELRRKSGHSQPLPSVLYTEEERAQLLKARAAGTWLHGAGEASGNRKRGKKRAQREEVEEVVPVAKGRRADGEPKCKRGRPSNAELTERKARKAEANAAKAAAAAAARSAAARKGRKKKARSTVIDDDESGDDAAAAYDNEAAAAGDEAAAAPSSASSSSSSDDEDASGSGAESMEHSEGGSRREHQSSLLQTLKGFGTLEAMEG
ncbi:hypothetical protein CBR_g17571 [Chara braunii]|uniref:DUF659 domain-containing protein n=1 Tax=Chara braunii TaxID=69332 RepID=A0A388KUW9_CHABU|nr:hypothetical protein CBR_g17571 [Chara braunii]|eukprot:GBG73860.1 hypothetical protein CBR_g17571 [Chara braunii]